MLQGIKTIRICIEDEVNAFVLQLKRLCAVDFARQDENNICAVRKCCDFKKIDNRIALNKFFEGMSYFETHNEKSSGSGTRHCLRNVYWFCIRFCSYR